MATNTGDVTCPASDRRIEGICTPESVVEVLADDDAIDLFRHSTTPKTVRTLAEQGDLPLSTAYRKIGALEDAGLVRRLPSDSSRVTTPDRYERVVEGVSVTLRDGLSVEYVLTDGE